MGWDANSWPAAAAHPKTLRRSKNRAWSAPCGWGWCSPTWHSKSCRHLRAKKVIVSWHWDKPARWTGHRTAVGTRKSQNLGAFLLHCSEKGDDLEPGSIPQTQQKVYSECNLGNLFMGIRKRGLNLPTGLRRAAPCNTSLDSCTALCTPSFRSHFYSKTHKKLKTSDLLPGFLSVSWEERRIKRCLYILSH